MKLFVFPRWANKTRQIAGVVMSIAPLYVIGLVWYGFSPKTTDVGYEPKQPVPYSHALHAGQLAIDCRYCHNTVDKAAMAAIPATETCMNCHQRVRAKSPKLELVRQSYATGEPIPWVKVHDLPDYVYFNHSAHVTRGIGCVSCHGRIDRMEEVYQHETLSMGWCLDCHRAPEQNLRPPEEVTNMDWKPPGDPIEYGKRLREQNNINPPTDCSTCHR
ncbi:MAG: cytochrome c3 family protein [Myxococcales bacterium]|nr:cytochrome c3 family protein [Myxococcales bacterium]MCB9583036.1 cytochrome c3 family protein [Polyangiaceae bacterium]